MALNIKVIQHSQFIEIIVAGIFNFQESLMEFPNVLATCKTTGLTKVLIDFRQLKGIPAATEKILYTLGIEDHYAEYLSNKGKPLQIAYVGKSPLIGSEEPGLLLARENNLPFNLFTDISKACKWLGVNPG